MLVATAVAILAHSLCEPLACDTFVDTLEVLRMLKLAVCPPTDALTQPRTTVVVDTWFAWFTVTLRGVGDGLLGRLLRFEFLGITSLWFLLPGVLLRIPRDNEPGLVLRLREQVPELLVASAEACDRARGDCVSEAVQGPGGWFSWGSGERGCDGVCDGRGCVAQRVPLVAESAQGLVKSSPSINAVVQLIAV